MTAIRDALAFALLIFSSRVCSIYLTHTSGPGARAGGFRTIPVPYHAVAAAHERVSSLPGDTSLGQLLAYEPSAPANGDLFVFLPGSTQQCDVYSELLETTARSMHTVCLPYDNRVPISSVCGDNNRCYPDLRLEAFNGSFFGVHGNNIESRLASALAYLARTDNASWSQYLNSSTSMPTWSRVRLAGHSQGAGSAALIGYYRELARVVQFSGVCDRSNWTSSLGPPMTPPSRFYGLASSWDTLLCPSFTSQVLSWFAEGSLQGGDWPHGIGIRDNLTVANLHGSHHVLSYILPPIGCDMIKYNTTCDVYAHDSTAMNGWPGGSPYMHGVWQALCGV